jgi:hypothetical protein
MVHVLILLRAEALNFGWGNAWSCMVSSGAGANLAEGKRIGQLHSSLLCCHCQTVALCRQLSAGDQLRVFYENLSKDPNSLANLDQVGAAG